LTNGSKQWVRLYRLKPPYGAEIVHAHYVEHRFVRHSHEHFVIGLVEEGVGNTHIMVQATLLSLGRRSSSTGMNRIPANLERRMGMSTGRYASIQRRSVN